MGLNLCRSKCLLSKFKEITFIETFKVLPHIRKPVKKSNIFQIDLLDWWVKSVIDTPVSLNYWSTRSTVLRNLMLFKLIEK